MWKQLLIISAIFKTSHSAQGKWKDVKDADTLREYIWGMYKSPNKFDRAADQAIFIQYVAIDEHTIVTLRVDNSNKAMMYPDTGKGIKVHVLIGKMHATFLWDQSKDNSTPPFLGDVNGNKLSAQYDAMQPSVSFKMADVERQTEKKGEPVESSRNQFEVIGQEFAKLSQ